MAAVVGSLLLCEFWNLHMDIRLQLREYLTSQFGDAILSEDNFRDQQSFIVRPESILDVCHALHDHDDLTVNMLADITAVDWLGDDYETLYGRFEVVYNLYSLKHAYRFFLKAFLPADKPELSSITAIWNGANWMEREIWDLFGITFAGHPDLTKILTPDELEGHPLRKDFPLTYEQPQFTFNKDLPPEVIR
jgi:NADH-quinone oxidoreductase subunit C